MSQIAGRIAEIPSRGPPVRTLRRWLGVFLNKRSLIQTALLFFHLVVCAVAFMGSMFGVWMMLTVFDESQAFFVGVVVCFLVMTALVPLTLKYCDAIEGTVANPFGSIKATVVKPSGLWDRDLDEPL